MKLYTKLIKGQKVVSYILMLTSIVLIVLSLGFMTNFYELFYNGTAETYEYFKDLQILNNAIFNASIIIFVASLFLIAFDITKKVAGIFGLSYVIGFNIYIFIKALDVFRVNSYFYTVYKTLNFTEVEGYNPSELPFILINTLFGVLMLMAVVLLVIVSFNYIKKSKNRKQELV